MTVDVDHPTRLTFFKGDDALPGTIARRAYDRSRYLVRRARARAAAEYLRATVTVFNANDPRDPLGLQIVPPGRIACTRCDILTRVTRLRRDPDVCGYCATELIRAEAA